MAAIARTKASFKGICTNFMRSLSFLGDQRPHLLLEQKCKAPQEKSLCVDYENCVEKRMNIDEKQYLPFRFGTMQNPVGQKEKAQREAVP
jgi:hypothetical protein